MQFFTEKKERKKKEEIPTSVVSLFIMGYLKNILLGAELERFPSVMYGFVDSQSSPSGSDTHSCHLPKLFVKYQLISQELEWNFRNVILLQFNSSLDTIPGNLVSGSPHPVIHSALPEVDTT